MFGGVTNSGLYLDDLWTYNAGTNVWTNITPGTSPPARTKAGFTYDPVAVAAFLYGGEDASSSRADLWKYDIVAGTWTSLLPAPPRPRFMDSTPMVYDSSVARHILAGKDSLNGTFITWLYNSAANTWTGRAPATSPGPRSGHTLTFERISLRTILFGGAEGLSLFADWWEYNATANTWVKLGDFIPNVTPVARTGHGMTFGPNGAVSIMFGGVDSTTAYQPETWYYVHFNNVWLQPPATAPGGRRDHAMAWDSGRDKTLMFGGRLASGTVTNQTWIWGTGYYTTGTYESATFDPGCVAPNWDDLWWNATTPATTNVRFKLATSASPNPASWTFLGANGLPGTFYDTPGTPVNAVHDGQQYFRWQATLTTGDTTVTPALNDVAVNYVCPISPPQITATSPADGATGVLETADIVVTFSEPMQELSVTFTFSDGTIAFSTSWNPGSTVLTLSHGTALKECTGYTMQITAGKDQNDNLDLIPGPVPNPWSFTTECVNPFIVSTVPADADINVAQTADVLVTFSEPMTTASVTFTVTGGITFIATWNPAETVLTLSHGVAFAACTGYTVQITAGTDKAGLPLVAGPAPNPWSFTTVCGNPSIVSTDPADGATGVALNADVVVTFSTAMNIGTVTWTISGGVILTYTWAPGNTVVTLSHAAPFAELTPYTVQITAGSDTSGNPLVPGPAPNPWTFTTMGVNPFIVTTNPADAAPNVAVGADVIVTFSEAMNPASVSANSAPVVVFSSAWNPGNTILTLSHAAPFVQCTQYTITVSGSDTQALPLVAGPVPNPWAFTATCPLTAPANLRASIAGADVSLSWDAVVGATGYKVYSAQNRFANFPSAWTQLGTPAVTTFTATGHGTDVLTHFYVVRATTGAADGPNSTMGVKAHLSLGFSAANTNIAWFSLPYSSTYARASDVATALGQANIDAVGKWDPATQTSVVYYFARGAWRGTDFSITAGNGLFLGVKRTFTWDVAGTDSSTPLAFAVNGAPMGNVNWVGIPYTGVYSLASAIANELTSTKIVEVGLWNAATQTVVRWYWTGTVWTGTDFAIAPGAGIYIILASSFTWTPILITPAVP